MDRADTRSNVLPFKLRRRQHTLLGTVALYIIHFYTTLEGRILECLDRYVDKRNDATAATIGDIVLDIHRNAAATAHDFDKSFNDVIATVNHGDSLSHYHRGPDEDVIVHDHHGPREHHHVLWHTNDHDAICSVAYSTGIYDGDSHDVAESRPSD